MISQIDDRVLRALRETTMDLSSFTNLPAFARGWSLHFGGACPMPLSPIRSSRRQSRQLVANPTTVSAAGAGARVASQSSPLARDQSSASCGIAAMPCHFYAAHQACPELRVNLARWLAIPGLPSPIRSSRTRRPSVLQGQATQSRVNLARWANGVGWPCPHKSIVHHKFHRPKRCHSYPNQLSPEDADTTPFQAMPLVSEPIEPGRRRYDTVPSDATRVVGGWEKQRVDLGSELTAIVACKSEG
jgi:hypothetical protein